jgi:tetratricopeptide (TPR) repeat protein
MEEFMKIEGLSFIPHTNNVKASVESNAASKDFSTVIKIRDGNTQGVVLPKNTTKDLVQDFAEWYFKEGKSYESSKSYKQAISAYEKSNSAEPDIDKSHTIDEVRKKAYGK